MRGGGAGPWGAVTALTIKLYKPRNDCQKDCYVISNIAWANTYEGDYGKMAEELLTEYLLWAAKASKYWSGYFTIAPLDETRYVASFGDFMYAGSPDDDDAKSLDYFQ
jgi:hypothetical protein